MASKRIAFVTMNLHEGYPALLWPGIVDGAKELGYECCCLPVSRMFSDDHAEQQEGALTMFLNRKRFSGMVLATNLFGHAAKTQRMEQFIRNSGLPCTTIGNPVTGWPCVSVDNVAGMRELVLGFVERQNMKRFAYVRGPIGHDEAEIRYQTFINTLASRQIKFDPDLWIVEIEDRQGRAFVDEPIV